MDSYSAQDAARILGTNIPRVQRSIRTLGLPVKRGPNGRVKLTPDQLSALRAKLGCMSRVFGLSRVEAQVLAALARSGRGLVSIRAVARRAGVSPTTAGRAVRALTERGLVVTTRDRIAEGRAREVDALHANVASPSWTHLAPMLARIELPTPVQREAPVRVPKRLAHLFWNVDRDRLDLVADGAYLAERLLSTLDLDGLAWGIGALTAVDWEVGARSRGLPDRVRALALNIAAHLS